MADGAWGGSPECLGAPSSGPSGAWQLGPGPGPGHPRGPSRRGVHSGPAALWPGLPEAMLLWRLPASLPPGPRLLKAPAQGWSELRQVPLPLLPNTSRTCPQPWKPAPSGARGWLPHSPALICPRHPRCPPGTPPAELSLPHSPHLSTAQKSPHFSQAGGPHSSLPQQQQAAASRPAPGTACSSPTQRS